MAKLHEYRRKRRFDRTPEPSGKAAGDTSGRRFVVQKHAARRLHYDFRLELDGVLKSWAVPKGPSLDPRVKALAVEVEDHPLEYGSFEGVIPAGQYGGGTVMIWDHGVWASQGDAAKAYQNGKLSFQLQGEKLQGRWTLVRMHTQSRDEDDSNWLLIKSDDDHARSADDFDVCRAAPLSVLSQRTLDEIAADADRVWTSDGQRKHDGQQSDQQSSASGPSAAILPGAQRKKLPRSFAPQLATAVARAPRGDDWLHELKFDGYRLLCRIDGGEPQLLTRRGNDWTHRFPTVAQAVAELQCAGTIIDGEVVVLAKNGTTDFQALQNLLSRGRDDDVVYFAFDLPFFNGFDLTQTPLADRKRLLAEMLSEQPTEGVLRYSDHITGQGDEVFMHACRRALEGIVSKRADGVYQQRRSHDWVKSKCIKRQEFVVGGWTDPSGSRQAFGALLLGYYEDQSLRYCGRVGTGFNQQSLQDVKRRLRALAAETPPFSDPPAGREARDVHWVQPTLVAEVEFANWTADGLLRQASFQGLREDKSPLEINREDVSPAGKKPEKASPLRKTAVARKVAAGTSRNEVAGVPLTHPDRVLYPDQGITKRELAEFYEAIADWILPHLVGRPLTMVRCPKGRGGQCFYQKHLTDSMPHNLTGVKIEEKGVHEWYVVLDDLAGLISLVQMSVLELHPWPARKDRLDRPDRLVLDLDPAPDVPWRRLAQAAIDVRERLNDAGLKSFPRTSGGKGLHVVVPLERRATWEQLKRFARALADAMSSEFPDRYIATASKARREGKIFIDYLRNQRGATAVASYSTRARADAPVATPVRWDEVNARLRPDKYNVRNLRRRLSALTGDPWEGFFQVRQSLPKVFPNAS